MSVGSVQLDMQREQVTLRWDDGVVGEFIALWLADNRAEDRHASGQRLIDVVDLPEPLSIRSASVSEGRLRVEFDGGWPAFERPLDWLRATVGPLAEARAELGRHAWLEGATLAADRDFAWESHDRFVASVSARGAWLRRLARDGLAFLRAVPCVEGTIVSTCSLMGEIGRTNYSVFFDLRVTPDPTSLGFTDLGLGLHTDNPYRDPVPGFQAMHVLTAAPQGGDSLFADGLALARHLRETDRATFEILTRTPVTFHYRSDDADLCSVKPLIELGADGDVRAVHYNSRSVAPLRMSAGDTERFYRAYRTFAALLRAPRFQLALHLADGELVVFDNHRILHGRTAFASQRHRRHLQGCYLTRDSVLSNAARLP